MIATSSYTQRTQVNTNHKRVAPTQVQLVASVAIVRSAKPVGQTGRLAALHPNARCRPCNLCAQRLPCGVGKSLFGSEKLAVRRQQANEIHRGAAALRFTPSGNATLRVGKTLAIPASQGGFRRWEVPPTGLPLCADCMPSGTGESDLAARAAGTWNVACGAVEPWSIGKGPIGAPRLPFQARHRTLLQRTVSSFTFLTDGGTCDGVRIGNLTKACH